jgi:hypothetical protein
LNNRGLKNRSAFSNAIETRLYKAFTELSQETRITQSKLLDEAIEDLLIKYGKLPPKKGQCPF